MILPSGSARVPLLRCVEVIVLLESDTWPQMFAIKVKASDFRDSEAIKGSCLMLMFTWVVAAASCPCVSVVSFRVNDPQHL